MGIAWALSLYTVQYIDEEIYGASVIGGNILKVDKNGITHIVWENDFSDQNIGGVFLHSVLCDGGIYFFPYLAKVIVKYDIGSNCVEKIAFIDKCDNEAIYAHIFQNEIFMFGLSTGRVWNLRSTGITCLNEELDLSNDFIKTRRLYEKDRVLFSDPFNRRIMIYDCRSNSWISKRISFKPEEACIFEDDLWYIENGNLHVASAKTGNDEMILEGDGDYLECSLIQTDEVTAFYFESKRRMIYKIDLESHSAFKIDLELFSENPVQWGAELGKGILFWMDSSKLGGLFYSGDRYAVIDVNDMSIKNASTATMDDEAALKIKERCLKISYSSIDDHVIFENEKENLSWFLDSLN